MFYTLPNIFESWPAPLRSIKANFVGVDLFKSGIEPAAMLRPGKRCSLAKSSATCVKAAAKIEHIDEIFLSAVLRGQALEHLVAVSLVLLHFHKRIFGLEHLPNILRRIGAQGDVSLDLAAFLLRRLDDLRIARLRPTIVHKGERDRVTASRQRNFKYPISISFPNPKRFECFELFERLERILLISFDRETAHRELQKMLSSRPARAPPPAADKTLPGATTAPAPTARR